MTEARRVQPVRARIRTSAAATIDSEPASLGGRDERRGTPERATVESASLGGRDAHRGTPEPATWSIPPEVITAARLAAAAAAAVVANTSTGSAVIVAVALALALAERRSAVAVGLVVVAATVRYGSSTLDEWAGLQTVLGLGVEIGPVTGAASAWLCLVALVLAAGPVPGAAAVGLALDRVLPALALGGLGAAVAAGAGPDGDLWIRVAAVVVVAAVAFIVSGERFLRFRHRRVGAVVVAVAAVVTAGWPG